MSARVLVVDNYDSFTYNLVQYLGELGCELDTCICIRTVVVAGGVAHVQAGGGTVADARPDYEYEESRSKARGVVSAIELAVAQEAWP